MSLASFTVEYSTNGSTWTALTNVQNVSITIGRQTLQDSFAPSRCRVIMRYPTGYASPITALVVNTFVRVKRTGLSPIYPYIWLGVIRDVTAQYGIPYVGSVGAADYLTIEVEGGLAYAGRSQGNDFVVPAGYADAQIEDVKDHSGVQLEWESTYQIAPFLAASTVSGSYAEWVNTLAVSTGSSIYDGGTLFGAVVRPKTYNTPLTVGFSDTTNNATNQVYDEIKFDSLEADYYNQVEVNTNTVGTVVVNSGVEPYRTLRVSTFNSTTGQATDLANYLLGIYGTPSFGISSVSCLAEAQNTIALEMGTFWFGIIGAKTTVVFRGTTYPVTILGASIEATPGSTRYTYQLTDSDLTPYLILNSASFGILGTNKLSW